MNCWKCCHKVLKDEDSKFTNRFSNKGIIGDLKNCFCGVVGPEGFIGVDLREWEERNW